jgi:CheY-like chemotaxis protein
MSTNPFAQRVPLCLMAVILIAPVFAFAADEYADDMVGQDAAAWNAWRAAANAIEREERDKAAKLLGDVMAMNISDLRLALMADRTGSLGLESWAKLTDAPEPVKKAVDKIKSGRKQRALAEDGWHFAAIGRFKYADASFKALDEANSDPVALLELARLNPNRHAILIKLIGNAEVGPSVKRFLQLLDLGEEKLRMDPNEIALNISKLTGQPRMAFNAAGRLKAAGEYAVPHLLQFLQDSNRKDLHPAIIQLLPQIGRDALNPLCVSLGMSDNVIRQVVINALVQIGYRQALPYLAKLANDEKASADVRSAAKQALASLGAGNADQAALFLELGDGYYNNIDSLRADPRRDTANVWYLRDDGLRLVSVPAVIFNDIMAMRSSEEALLANPNLEPATALWLASNIRREARLGLDVESDKPDTLAAKDATRPDNYPRSIYFARAAGPKYNHMVLARAFNDRDPGVALGAIAALRETAGEPSLVGAEDLKQPLVETLAFPNRQVRVKAALALGTALPKTEFSGAQNVVPVLAEALSQANRQAALIVDPDSATANKVQAILSAAGYECVIGPSLNRARELARKSNVSAFDVIVLASDISAPDCLGAIAELRREFQTAATPILLFAKQGQSTLASSAARTAVGVEVLLSDITDIGDPKRISDQLNQRIARASKAMGMSPLSIDQSLSLALQAADVLRLIAQGNLKVFDLTPSTAALISAVQSKSEPLRIRAAHALALHPSADGQRAMAEAALNAQLGSPERLAMFASLAESARTNGNLLGSGDVVSKLIDFTMKEQDLVLRAAGSAALGALDLPGNKASEIIRSQYRG